MFIKVINPKEEQCLVNIKTIAFIEKNTPSGTTDFYLANNDQVLSVNPNYKEIEAMLTQAGQIMTLPDPNPDPETEKKLYEITLWGENETSITKSLTNKEYDLIFHITKKIAEKEYDYAPSMDIEEVKPDPTSAKPTQNKKIKVKTVKAFEIIEVEFPDGKKLYACKDSEGKFAADNKNNIEFGDEKEFSKIGISDMFCASAGTFEKAIEKFEKEAANDKTK